MAASSLLHPEGRGYIILLGALTAQSALAIDVLLPALPGMVADLAMTPGTVQLTIGVFIAGFAFGQVAWGWLSDWLGRRPVILIGTGGYAAATLMCAVADDGTGLIVWRFVLGVFSSASMAAARAMMRDHFSGVHLARQMAAITAVFFLSPILAPQLGILLLHLGGWRSVFWVPGVIGVASFVVSWYALGESLPLQKRSRSSAAGIWRIVKGIVSHPLSGPCLAVQASMSIGLLTWISSCSLILTGYYAVPAKYFGLLFAATASMQLLGAAVCNRMLKRRSPALVMALGGGCCALGGLLVFGVAQTEGPLLPLVAGMWMFMLGFGLIVPSSGGMALHAFGAVGGLAAAVLGSAQSLVGSLGSVLSALLFDGTPHSLGIGVVLSSLLAGLACVVLSYRLHHRPELLTHPETAPGASQAAGREG